MPVEWVVREEQAEPNQRMEYLHSQQPEETVNQVEGLLLLSYPHHQTILIQTDHLQMYLHHPATGVVGDIAEAAEVDLVVAEEAAVAAEEDNELNFIIPYSKHKEAARINFSYSLLL